MLHDADYEQWPEEHPNRTVAWLREIGEEEIAHAVSAHYTKWGVPYETQLDKALLACDELTGLIIAACLVRPEGVATLKAQERQEEAQGQSLCRQGRSGRDRKRCRDAGGRSFRAHPVHHRCAETSRRRARYRTEIETMASNKLSAGLAMYRQTEGGLEILLGHPGGPFFRKKDVGSWSIPKGLVDGDEEPLAAARREFTEETGLPTPAEGYTSLGEVQQKSGKVVRAWAFEGRLRSGHHREQYLRARVAAALGPYSDLSRNRPRRFFYLCGRQAENQFRPGRVYRSARREIEILAIRPSDPTAHPTLPEGANRTAWNPSEPRFCQERPPSVE